MKYLLISLNVLLACALGYLVWKSTSDPVSFSSKTETVPRTMVDKKKTPVSLTRKATQESPALTEEKIAAVVSNNIFEGQRVPEATVNKTTRANQQQIRADMSLVGTYTIGDALGAIILQRLQGNSQQQLKALQQKEYEQYQASATRVTDPKKKNAEGGTDAKDADSDDAPLIITAGNPTVSANNVFRQHLKVGDTTVNGYKLVEVTRTSAVLTKNSERIELSLLKPSEAGNIARQRQNNQQGNNNNNNRNNNNNNRNQQNNNNNNNRNQQANRNNITNNRNNNNNRTNNNRNNNRNDDVEWF